MNRVWMAAALGLVALTGSAGEALGQQARSLAEARRMHNFVEYGVPDSGYVPNAYYVNSTAALPPNVYARRATPGGLIETAFRRMNPFSAPSRASGVSFVPDVYRQPTAGYRVVARPGYRMSGHEVGYHSGVVSSVPTGEKIPGVNCPTCPK